MGSTLPNGKRGSTQITTHPLCPCRQHPSPSRTALASASAAARAGAASASASESILYFKKQLLQQLHPLLLPKPTLCPYTLPQPHKYSKSQHPRESQLAKIPSILSATSSSPFATTAGSEPELLRPALPVERRVRGLTGMGGHTFSTPRPALPVDSWAPSEMLARAHARATSADR